MARPMKNTELTSTQRDELLGWLRAPKTAQSLAQRARLIISLASGKTVDDVATEENVSRNLVRRWRARFIQDGPEGLKDRPRPGKPRKINESITQKVLSLSAENLPQEATHWSVRVMARYAQTTPWQVRQIWEEAGLKPHLSKTFKLSRDPHFAEKVIDVVGLYMNPPDNTMVLSIDEKTQIQALERTQRGLPTAPGKTETRTHDYKRHGTVSLYAALSISSGKVIGQLTEQHRAKEFIDFLAHIDRNTPSELNLHLIADNSSTHKTHEVKVWLAAHPRFTLHFTPTSSSWLNAVEGWFGQLERRALYRGSFTTTTELREAIELHISAHNRLCAKPFKWTASAEAILASVAEARKALGYAL